MKELITANKIRELARSGKTAIEYSRQTSIVTPEAKDLANALKIELKATDYVVTKKIYRKYCGIRPNFSISDHELLVFQIKEAVIKVMPEITLDDEALTAIIEKVLTELKQINDEADE